MQPSFAIDVFHTRIGVHLDDSVDAADAAAIARSWADVASSEAPRRTLSAGTAVDRYDVAASDAAALAERLTSTITLRLLDAVGGSLLLFHAAGLADANGRVLALVGPSGRGKTTASRALGAHYGYVTDETVAIDDAAADRVLPYRKPLSIIETAGRPKRQLAPSSIGLRPLPSAELALAAVAILDRDADHAGPPSIEAVELGDGIPELVQQSSYLTKSERPLQRIAALLDRAGGLVRIRYAEAETLADSVELLFDRSPAAAAWEPFAAVAHASSAHEFQTAVDAIRVDAGILLLTPTQVQLIAGIGPSILDAIVAGERPVDRVVRDFGTPDEGDAEAIVDARIDELVAGGILYVR